MKRFIMLFVTAITLAFVLTACGGSTDETEAGAHNSGSDQVTLTWMKQTGSDKDAEWEDLMIKEFEEQNEGVNVEIQRLAYDNYITSLQTKLASGDGPDVFYVDRSNMPVYVENDYLADLTDTEASTHYEQEDLESFKFEDGKIYALNVNANSMFVTYNRDVFAESGVNEVPKTLDEFYDATKKIEEAGFVPIANGFKESWVVSGNIQTDYITGVLAKDENAIIDVVSREKKFADSELWKEEFTRFFERYKFSNDDPFATDWNAVNSMLANKEAGMILNGSWTVSNTLSKNPDANLGVFALPVSNNPDETLLLIQPPTSGYSVYNDSPNKEMATNFINHITTAESATKYAEMTQSLVVVKGAKVPTDTQPMKDIQSYIDSNQVFRQGKIDHNFPNQFRDAFEKTIAKYLVNDDLDVDALVKELDAEFDRIAK